MACAASNVAALFALTVGLGAGLGIVAVRCITDSLWSPRSRGPATAAIG